MENGMTANRVGAGLEKLSGLFDAGTFVETGAFVKRGCNTEEFEVIACGYGSVGGKLVFAFAQDSSKMKGAIDEVYVFDQALTPGQIATLYADGDASAVPAKSTEPEPEVIRDYSTTVASGTIIGNIDGSSVYGDAYSEIKEVGVGETVAFKFKNYVPSKLNAEGKNVFDFANEFRALKK